MSNIFDLFKKIESTSSAQPVSFLVVGLGNIGKQYELTRHNAGFLAIDYIAEKYGAKIDRVKFHATVGEANIGGCRVLLMKPSTLMNNSGIAVAEARGVIICTAHKLGVKISEYTPLQVKQAVVGYGKAEKHQVISMVTSILKLPKPPKPDDTADAVAIALCHAQSRGSAMGQYFNRR